MDASSAASTRRQRTRARILEGAARAFDQHGFEGATVAHILAAAGVSRRTFYQHFPGKADALLALGRAGLGQKQRALAEDLAAGASPLALLRRSLDEDAAWFVAHPSLAAPLIQAALRGDLVTAPEGTGSHRALFLQLIQAAQQGAELRADVPPAELALLLSGALGQAVLTWSRRPDEDLRARLDRLLSVVLDGARP